MVVTPVRALNSIKPDGVGRVANYPVEIWIFRHGIGDSILGKRFTSLVEDSRSNQVFTRNSASLSLT